MYEDKRIYYINSKDRLSGSDSDFNYSIQFPPQSRYDSVVVLQASIPKSYYAIFTGEYFVLSENGVEVKISLPEGNYSRKSLSIVVQTLLTSNSPQGATYTITYPNSNSAETGKLTFTKTETMGSTYFIFVPTNDLNEHLGFEPSSTNLFVDNVLVSTNVINLQQEDRLFIHSTMCTNGDDNILQEIYSSTTTDFSSITYQQVDVPSYAKKLVSNNENVYRFYLADKNGRVIDLNGQGFTITILVYRTDPIYDIVKKYINLRILKQ